MLEKSKATGKSYSAVQFIFSCNLRSVQNQVARLFYNNNIKFAKCELYSDFVQSFLRLAFDTYMGDDVTTVEQQIQHFRCQHL